jgi:glycosyltransferase involved in cell wall biosynthesis
MAEKTIISIIIPVYNVEKYLLDCLNSVAKQDLRNVEVLLVNDGSTDKSGDICQRFVDKYDSFKLIVQKNGGLSSARNTGLSNASGKYVQFIDSDDILPDGSVGRILSYINLYKPDTLKIGFDRFTENIPKINESSKNSIIFENGYQSLQKLMENVYDNYSWSYVSKREIYTKNHIVFPEGRNYEDMATTYKILANSRHCLILNEKLYFYRIREGSISNHKSKKNAEDLLKSLDEVKSYFEQNNINMFIGNFITYYSLLGFKENNKARKFWSEYISANIGRRQFKNLRLRYKIAIILFKLNLYSLIIRLRSKAG